MAAAGDGFFPPPYQIAEESLQSLTLLVFYFCLPTYQNGDENL
jgi:hypothetical protein